MERENLCKIFQNEKIKEKIEKCYQNKLCELYMFAWNVIFPGLNTSNSKWAQSLQDKLQKNKNRFLFYLTFHDWKRQEEDAYVNQRLIQIMAIYLAYGSLNPLEKLHIAKYYCQYINESFGLVDKKALTEIAKQSYLQNSLYESGKSSYIKK